MRKSVINKTLKNNLSVFNNGGVKQRKIYPNKFLMYKASHGREWLVRALPSRMTRSFDAMDTVADTISWLIVNDAEIAECLHEVKFNIAGTYEPMVFMAFQIFSWIRAYTFVPSQFSNAAGPLTIWDFEMLRGVTPNGITTPEIFQLSMVGCCILDDETIARITAERCAPPKEVTELSPEEEDVIGVVHAIDQPPQLELLIDEVECDYEAEIIDVILPSVIGINITLDPNDLFWSNYYKYHFLSGGSDISNLSYEVWDRTIADGLERLADHFFENPLLIFLYGDDYVLHDRTTTLRAMIATSLSSMEKGGEYDVRYHISLFAMYILGVHSCHFENYHFDVIWKTLLDWWDHKYNPATIVYYIAPHELGLCDISAREAEWIMERVIDDYNVVSLKETSSFISSQFGIDYDSQFNTWEGDDPIYISLETLEDVTRRIADARYPFVPGAIDMRLSRMLERLVVSGVEVIFFHTLNQRPPEMLGRMRGNYDVFHGSPPLFWDFFSQLPFDAGPKAVLNVFRGWLNDLVFFSSARNDYRDF